VLEQRLHLKLGITVEALAKRETEAKAKRLAAKLKALKPKR
jgi:hypothetical protein